MAKEYVPIFFDWLEVTQDLTAEEKGNLIDAVVAYAAGEEYEHLLTGGVRIAFRFLKGQVDRNNAISDKRSAAGSNKREQNETNENKPEQNVSNFPKEKEKEKENKKDKERDTERKPTRFSPPTVDEVEAYCKERNNGVNAQRFVDFYEAKGWKIGKEQMKSWKACVRTWEQRDKQKPTKTVVAQQYEQRDYSGVQAKLEDETTKEMEEWLKTQEAG